MDTGSFTSTFRNGTKLKAVLTDKKLDISSQRKWGGGADDGPHHAHSAGRQAVTSVVTDGAREQKEV